MYIKELREWIKDQPDHGKLVVLDDSMSGYIQWRDATSKNIKIEIDTPETLKELEREINHKMRTLKEFVGGR